MARGRKPIDAELNSLRGNPGNRRGTDAAPVAGRGARCPSWLDDTAREEWKRVAPHLRRAGKLGPLDVPIVAAYCKCFSRWKQIEEQIDAEGLVNGEGKRHPLLGALDQIIRQLRALASELGITPRTRAASGDTGGEQDAFDKFMEE